MKAQEGRGCNFFFHLLFVLFPVEAGVESKIPGVQPLTTKRHQRPRGL